MLSSGDEVRPVGECVLPHQIRNSNGPMIAQLLRSALKSSRRNCCRMISPRRRTPSQTITKEVDLLITIGGISAGERDHFPAAFDERPRNIICTARRFSRANRSSWRVAPSGCIIVGLPGNPVSSLVCACLFIWPIVMKLSGCNDRLPWRRGHDCRARGRQPEAARVSAGDSAK